MALGHFLLAATMLALVACQRSPALPQASADSTYSDPAYRADLLAHVAADQAIRDTFAAELRANGTVPPPVLIRMLAIDSANLAWLAPRVQAARLPTRAQFGVDAVKAEFMLIQHADHDLAFQARMLPLLDPAHARGELTRQELAMLTDRVAKAEGKPQRYGTQATIANGRQHSTRLKIPLGWTAGGLPWDCHPSWSTSASWIRCMASRGPHGNGHVTTV